MQHRGDDSEEEEGEEQQRNAMAAFVNRGPGKKSKTVQPTHRFFIERNLCDVADL